MELYFITKDIKDEKEAAHLLVRIGAKSFQLIKQLIAPSKIADATYADLVKIMKDHLNLKPSEIMERCTFGKAIQGKNESVAD